MQWIGKLKLANFDKITLQDILPVFRSIIFATWQHCRSGYFHHSDLTLMRCNELSNLKLVWVWVSDKSIFHFYTNLKFNWENFLFHLCPNVAIFLKNVFIFKDRTLKKIILKGRGFWCGWPSSPRQTFS